MQTSNEVAIRVLHKQRGTDSVWSLDTLAEKVLTMRDMYERIEEGGSLVVSEALIRVLFGCHGNTTVCIPFCFRTIQ